MESELIVIVDELHRTFVYLWREISQIEGNSLKDLWAGATQRINENLSSRVLWILIAALFFSSLMFVICVGLVLADLAVHSQKKSKTTSGPRIKPRSDDGDATAADHELAKILAWADRVAPRNVIETLRAGDIDGAEKALLIEHRKQPENVGLMMYLLACCALRNDSAAYDRLVRAIFPDGLNADEEICRHAAEIGRLISPDRYPEDAIPRPNSVFEIESELIENMLGPISELSNVKTLLDLVRMDFEMGNTDHIWHLLVEIVVCGTQNERKVALNYSRRINQKSSA